jgi:hypothetical protein
MAVFYGDWNKVENILKRAGPLLKHNMKAATRHNAEWLRDQTKRTIRDGDPSWPPNSNLTTKAKGSSSPLIDHGDLMQAISAITLAPTVFFVGVPRKPGKGGGSFSLAKLAAVQEFGITIKPRKGRALAVPVSRQATDLARQYKGIRNIPGLFRPANTRVLALPVGAGGFEIMFILMTESVIPPRPFVSVTFERSRRKIARRWEMAVVQAMRGQRYAA